MQVFPLWHVWEELTPEGRYIDHSKLIGIYSTRELADAARERVRHKPGFCDYPEGFQLESHTLDRDEWIEGFVTEYFGLVRQEEDGG